MRDFYFDERFCPRCQSQTFQRCVDSDDMDGANDYQQCLRCGAERIDRGPCTDPPDDSWKGLHQQAVVMLGYDLIKESEPGEGELRTEHHAWLKEKLQSILTLPYTNSVGDLLLVLAEIMEEDIGNGGDDQALQSIAGALRVVGEGTKHV